MLDARRVRAIYAEVLFVPLYLGQCQFHEVAAFLESKKFRLFDFYNFAYGTTGQLGWGDALFLPVD